MRKCVAVNVNKVTTGHKKKKVIFLRSIKGAEVLKCTCCCIYLQTRHQVMMFTFVFRGEILDRCFPAEYWFR